MSCNSCGQSSCCCRPRARRGPTGPGGATGPAGPTGSGISGIIPIVFGAGDGIVPLNPDGGIVGGPYWLLPGNSDGSASLVESRLVLPGPGTIVNIHVRQNVPAGNGQNLAYTVYRNGIATILSAVIASTALEGSNGPTAIACVAGDELSIAVNIPVNIVATPTLLVASIGFRPS